MLLKMSLSGGSLILFIAVVRLLALNRFPKRIFMLLWSVALLRLLVPLELPFAYGIAQPAIKAAASKTAEIVSGRKAGQNFAVVIWLTGASAMLLVLGTLYIREYCKIREALPVPEEKEKYLRLLSGVPGRVKLRISDRIASPVAIGIVRPKIVLPKVLPPENDGHLKYVLLHETIHIKRGDNLWKIVMLLALCVHWFNPLVWMMYFLFNRDMELSCDEKVILLAGERAKKEYAMALLHLAEKQRRWSAFSAGFGKNAVKERIVAIMKFKKITVSGLICAVILTGVSVTVFAQGGGAAENAGVGEAAGLHGERTKEGRSINRSLAHSGSIPGIEKYIPESGGEAESAKRDEIEKLVSDVVRYVEREYEKYLIVAEYREESVREVSGKGF